MEISVRSRTGKERRGGGPAKKRSEGRREDSERLRAADGRREFMLSRGIATDGQSELDLSSRDLQMCS